ncbi:hypothetical protein PPL_09955 [Heterostelium album PN500]|uniref:Ankyrin repeat protein n=1 Tax=Heterostelium pallidum (strain ATCC 26659 / Pp 5 / PN500) TaxID=670386 RepID=D3BPN0_HETP5|nr:hypothetical protein PPL_09955 [Heterostelium album PN500]EFA76650.1 hypothetical protein PPL_09955 [Heterostelium album PN500]|eukprot:XP_020428782.1 hypothetical protein PPL_09955 [Heterostelium album PN500]
MLQIKKAPIEKHVYFLESFCTLESYCIFRFINEFGSNQVARYYKWSHVVVSLPTLLTYGYLDQLKRSIDNNLICFVSHHQASAVHAIDLFNHIRIYLHYIIRFGYYDMIVYLSSKYRNKNWYVADCVINSLAYRRWNFVRFFMENRFSEIDREFYPKIISSAAISTDMDILRYTCEKLNYFQIDKLSFYHLVECGYSNIVKYFLEPNQSNKSGTMECPSEAAERAAQRSAPNLLEYFSENHPSTITTKVLDTLAKQGDFTLLKKLIGRHTKVECSTLAIDQAAMNGKLTIVQWLTENSKSGCSTDALDYAAERGHLNIVEYLHHNRVEGCTKRALNLAATNGHLEVVKFLHYNRSEGCTTAAADGASQNGHLETLRFLLDNRSEGYSNQILDKTAKRGSIETLKFLGERTTDLKVHSNTLSNCSNFGYLEVIQHLVEVYRVPIDSKSIEKAIIFNYIDIVRYLLANSDGVHRRYQCSPEQLKMIITSDNLDMLKLLWEYQTFTQLSFGTLALHGRFEMIQYSIDNKIHLDCFVNQLE